MMTMFTLFSIYECCDHGLEVNRFNVDCSDDDHTCEGLI